MFEKISSTPDWSRAFAATSEYSGKIGNAIASAFVVAVDVVSLALRAAGPIIGNAIRGLVIALAELLVAIGRFLKDLIGGTGRDIGGARSAGAFDAGFGNWGKRRRSA